MEQRQLINLQSKFLNMELCPISLQALKIKMLHHRAHKALKILSTEIKSGANRNNNLLRKKYKKNKDYK